MSVSIGAPAAAWPQCLHCGEAARGRTLSGVEREPGRTAGACLFDYHAMGSSAIFAYMVVDNLPFAISNPCL